MRRPTKPVAISMRDFPRCADMYENLHVPGRPLTSLGSAMATEVPNAHGIPYGSNEPSSFRTRGISGRAAQHFACEACESPDTHPGAERILRSEKEAAGSVLRDVDVLVVSGSGLSRNGAQNPGGGGGIRRNPQNPGNSPCGGELPRIQHPCGVISWIKASLRGEW
jgi:hypothetical protein